MDGLFSMLFDTVVPTLGMARRADPDDHFIMEPTLCCAPRLDIPGDPATYFDKPIAVLTGPGAYSAGNYNAVRLGFHPRTRFFGKSTSSAFSPGHPVQFDAKGWHARVSYLGAYRKDTPDEFLTHTERRVDELVWLMAEDVTRGEDTVVKAALEWISQVGTDTEEHAARLSFGLSQNYPNPFADQSSIELSLPRSGRMSLTVYNVLGQEVIRLAMGFMQQADMRSRSMLEAWLAVYIFP